MHHLGLEYQVIKAVDGHSLSPEELAEVYDERIAKRLLRRPLAVGEIGAALSHKIIYQKMKEEHIEEAIIMEDDVKLSEDFADMRAGLHRLPSDWNILLMVSCDTEYPVDIAFSRREDVHLCGPHHARRYLGAAYGSQAYFIRRTYAEQMIQQMSPVILPIDTLLFDNRYTLRVPYAVYSKEGLRLRPRLGQHTWMLSSTNPKSRKKIKSPSLLQRLGSFIHDLRCLLSPMHFLLMLLSFSPIKDYNKLNMQARGEWAGKIFLIRIYLSIVRP